MNIINLINKKSNNEILSKEEINYFVSEYINNNILDYQMSSLLMAIKINGLNDKELIHYTEALINSGNSYPVNNKLVDKHSTGGVGDKTSITLLPILSAMGLKIFKISGKGLGFTGGTIDKLESIKGFNTNLSEKNFKNQIDKIGIAILGQNENLVPADGKIYALRDVSGTVDSIPLIAASIISKKIATGAKNILIDIKVGSGSFNKDLSAAKELARSMKVIANHFNRNLFALFSSMEQPLGYSIGNKIETIEAIDFLLGNYSQDYYSLIKKISTELYSKSKNISIEKAEKKFEEVLKNKKAYNILLKWFSMQGVNKFDKAIDFKPKYTKNIYASKDGYLKFKDVSEIGNSLLDINVGRKTKKDKLDYDAGIKLFSKLGDKISVGDKIAEIYSSYPIEDIFVKKINNLFDFSNEKIKIKTIIYEMPW